MSVQNYLEKGLSTQKVKERIYKYGKNEIKSQKIPSDYTFFIKQIKNPLVVVLLFAGITTIFLKDFTDSVVIFFAILINTTLGFIQEKKAFKSLESLKKMLNPKSWVLRNGEKIEIEAKYIVPFDLVWLYEGDKVPADGVIYNSNNLLINEAILTGESDAVFKKSYNLNPKEISKENLKKIDKKSKAYMGTIVVNGSSLMLVTKTGMNTKMGKIAEDLENYTKKKTPLEKRLDILAKFITVGVVLVSIGLFIYGISTGRDFTQMFTISVALAVAAIPEGLVVALTAILAIGMQRILKKNALVRNLMVAETLGTITCVCVDKTGTLTQGKLRVSETFFTNKRLAYKTSILANDMRDNLEIARWEWAKIQSKNHKFENPERILKEFPKNETIPFSSKSRFLAARVGNEIFLSGSPEELLNISSMSRFLVGKQRENIDKLAQKGRRLIGLAYIKESSQEKAKLAMKYLRKNYKDKLKIAFLGIISFTDPVRNDVKKTIQKALKAGIVTKIITGDHKGTALSVAKEIGLKINEDEIIEGTELETLSDKKLKELVNKIKLFARTEPSQKLRIVNALKSNREVVGMMGDGVNDAPALAAADIGIVVSSASQISKDAADMVLLDSNLKTIIDAIEEGRGIFDNLRKIILYLLSDTFSEIILIVTSLVMGWPIMITAAQILWINLIDDGFPSLALTIDPKDNDLLKRKPISHDENIISLRIRFLIILASLVSAGICLVVFRWTWLNYNLETARTMVFAILGLDSLIYVFSCRSLNKNIWNDSPLRNKYLIAASAFGIFLTLIAIYNPTLSLILNLTPIKIGLWLIIIPSSLLVFIFIELFKFIWSKFSQN